MTFIEFREVNNRTGKPFGTEEEIARCHSNGTLVPQREFNPNELEHHQTVVINHQSDPESDPVFWNLPSVVTIGPNTFLPVISINRIVYDQK
jgi:hypothetical protein